MQKIRATLWVWNPSDASKPGVEVGALVDTSAVMPVLPKEVIERLEITIIDKVRVTPANGQWEERDVAGPVTIAIGDREMSGSCFVGAVKSEPLIGQIVVASLDLIIDWPRNALRPRSEFPTRPS